MFSKDDGPFEAKNHKIIDNAKMIFPASKTNDFVFSNTSKKTFLIYGNL